MIPTAIISNNADFVGWARAHEHGDWNRAWSYFFEQVTMCLQPQFWIIGKFEKSAANSSMFLGIFIIPLWSFCFGWLFVKLDNWLNHFPVLGKKVF
jgi:hypothetical protein